MKKRITFRDIDSMEGHDFEYFCADVLKKNGFGHINVTVASGDYGIDILARQGGVTYAIQCKRYQGNVGNKAVQEALSGKVYYGCKTAVVMTNSYFTQQARETAQRTGVELWDRDRLHSMVKKAYPGQIWISRPKKQQKPKAKPKKKTGRRGGCLPFLLVVISVLILLAAYFMPKMEYYSSAKQDRPVAPAVTEAPTEATAPPPVLPGDAVG